MDKVVTVENDDISVEKSIVELGTDTVSGVEFTITSHADSPKSVRVIEELPAGVTTGDIGLNPDYYAEHWTTIPAGNRLEFTYQLDPEEEIKTLWGIRATAKRELTPFLTEPSLEVSAPSEEREDARNQERGSQGTPDSLEALWEAEREEATTQRQERIPRDRPSGGDSHSSDTLTSTLISEFRTGVVSDDERAALRDALELDTPHSLRIRTRWLQSQVAELMMYVDDIEQFVDEHGPPGELVNAVDQAVDELDSRIGVIEAARDTSDERHTVVRERIAALESRISEIDDVKEELYRVRVAVEAYEDHHDEHIQARLEDLEHDLEESLASIRGDLGDLEADIKAFKAWRERFAELLGSDRDSTT